MHLVEKVFNSLMKFMALREYNRFLANTRQAKKISQRTLQDILRTNTNTAYGRKYDFLKISNPADYSKVLPLTIYEDYRQYIKEIVSGQPNILTKDPIIYFGLSSGTTGQQKMIPTTSRSRRLIAKQMSFLTQGVLLHTIPECKKSAKGLVLMNIITNQPTASKIPSGAATSGGVQSIQKIIPLIWISPLEVYQIKEFPAANYLHLLFALQDKDLQFISAPFASSVYDLFAQLEKDWSFLVDDIERGKISQRINLQPEVRRRLEQKLKPNPQRARELAQTFSSEWKSIIQRIWPNFLYIASVSGGSFQIYGQKLHHYIDEIPIYSPVYGATEALIGIGIHPNNQSYVLLPNVAYHEFIPSAKIEEPQPRTLAIHQLKIGESYEVVITNYAGLYRYRLGDIVKVVDYYNQSPVLEFLYRQNQHLNLVGEKTSENAIYQSLQKSAKAWKREIVDFTTVADYNTSPAHYVFYIEVRGRLPHFTVFQSQQILEKALYSANPAYKRNRQAGKLAPLALYFVKSGTFQVFKRLLLSRGASITQLKIPRVISDQKLIKFLQKNLQVSRHHVV